MYQRAEQVADGTWDEVIGWGSFPRDTVGEQLVRAADSIGANIAESAGRYHTGDVIRFLYYARGSMRETRYWLKRSQKRRLISQEFFDQQMADLSKLHRELNAYVKYQRNRTVKDPPAEYELDRDDPNEPTN